MTSCAVSSIHRWQGTRSGVTLPVGAAKAPRSCPIYSHFVRDEIQRFEDQGEDVCLPVWMSCLTCHFFVWKAAHSTAVAALRWIRDADTDGEHNQTQ